MNGYIIGNKRSQDSVRSMNECYKSLKRTDSKIDIKFVQQTDPQTLAEHLKPFPGLKWNYPLNQETRLDKETGVMLRGYRTNQMETVFACLVSHARLWLRCVQENSEIMILEHDAQFIRKFEPFEWEGGVLGLNDPRGATFNSFLYHERASAKEGVQEVPWVDVKGARPQGLAGNSAYIIKPFAAKILLEKLKETGGWPNDALICKQHFDWIKVVYPYYTAVQGIRSTTTL